MRWWPRAWCCVCMCVVGLLFEAGQSSSIYSEYVARLYAVNLQPQSTRAARARHTLSRYAMLCWRKGWLSTACRGAYYKNPNKCCAENFAAPPVTRKNNRHQHTYYVHNTWHQLFLFCGVCWVRRSHNRKTPALLNSLYLPHRLHLSSIINSIILIVVIPTRKPVHQVVLRSFIFYIFCIFREIVSSRPLSFLGDPLSHGFIASPPVLWLWLNLRILPHLGDFHQSFLIRVLALDIDR